ncbi:ras-related protein Rab-31-like [Leptonychotes weddellii]|uniref:Ras-related protein Rab-31-like n=1 Tax=Leptonychotes weddellii TaxID=9713 RepID=A0A7F8Q252_LEPWE|nr:ras-related protein Rab-31-like [Leptonychotes weddellii]
MMAIRELKVCLLGDTGVGKSSIVCRFVQDHFDHNISPTIGASFMTKTVPCGNELHKFLIWDTAGQERVARSHPWTPMKMETMEQSNLGSKPRKPAGGAADLWAMVHCT